MTELDIVNYALDRLGAQPAASMADTGRNARIAIRNYSIVRDKVLRLFVWSCITKREALVLEEGVEGLRLYPYAYSVPYDCIRLNKVYSSGVEAQYTKEGDVIYCAMPDAVAQYNQDSTDPAEWDSLLQTAIGVLLASEIAQAVTGKEDKGKELYAEFIQLVTQAKGVGEEEAIAPAAQAALWIDY